MKLVPDFVNKFLPQLIEMFNCSENQRVKYIVECFSNGVICYDTFIIMLSYELQQTNQTIHDIAIKYIESEIDTIYISPSNLVVKAKYVSVWDNGNEIVSKCKLDLVGLIVSDIDCIEDNIEDLEILDREYIYFLNLEFDNFYNSDYDVMVVNGITNE